VSSLSRVPLRAVGRPHTAKSLTRNLLPFGRVDSQFTNHSSRQSQTRLLVSSSLDNADAHHNTSLTTHKRLQTKQNYTTNKNTLPINLQCTLYNHVSETMFCCFNALHQIRSIPNILLHITYYVYTQLITFIQYIMRHKRHLEKRAHGSSIPSMTLIHAVNDVRHT